jgi:hypothetical protein
VESGHVGGQVTRGVHVAAMQPQTQRLASGSRVERRDAGCSIDDVSREVACRGRMACGLRYTSGQGALSGSFARA